jgi:hypothetical protein
LNILFLTQVLPYPLDAGAKVRRRSGGGQGDKETGSGGAGELGR